MKKAKFINIVINGEFIKAENVQKVEISKVISDLGVSMNDNNMNKLIRIDNNIYSNDELNLIIKNFSRGHIKSSDGSELNKEEKMRSRYTKNDVLKWRNIYDKTGRPTYILSVYNAGDKYLYTIVNAAKIIIGLKSEIISDSRVCDMQASDFKELYDNDYISRKNPKLLIDEFIGFSSSNMNGLLSYLRKEEDIKLSLSDEVNTQIESAVFNKMKESFINKDIKLFTGHFGEWVAYIHLKNKVSEPEKISWTSILTFRANRDFDYITDSEEKYFEVKTTRTNSNMLFLSDAEKKFMEINENKWKLIRINISEILNDIGDETIINLSDVAELKRIILGYNIDDYINFYTHEQIFQKITGDIGVRVKL